MSAAAEDESGVGGRVAYDPEEEEAEGFRVPKVSVEYIEEAEERALGLWYEGQWENAESDGVPYRQARPHLEPIPDLKLR